MSYSWISSGGRYSNSSVVTSLKVKGGSITHTRDRQNKYFITFNKQAPDLYCYFCHHVVNITQPYPINPITIQKTFSYDYRQGFFGHFVVNISWINPPGMYMIHLLHPQILRIKELMDIICILAETVGLVGSTFSNCCFNWEFSLSLR